MIIDRRRRLVPDGTKVALEDFTDVKACYDKLSERRVVARAMGVPPI